MEGLLAALLIQDTQPGGAHISAFPSSVCCLHCAVGRAGASRTTELGVWCFYRQGD